MARVCSKHGCPETAIDRGYCKAHARPAWQGSTRRQRLPKDWSRIRRQVLKRDPICKLCKRALSTEADHIQAGDDHRLSALQGVCSRCHRRKSSSEGARAQR